ncbi:hypothetical protein NLX86_06615 [Streptomyces sp. A3M-1-3]|uniref:hypothetical protein n=1 Tax=Streptomyces sp. A3M-1-3 TaxID=2962044 RepID=UPI0020B6C28C|nr:hypothetical protein [Streptomyces sp. A3M-1-3]MCP3817819.1 hypothetical protein [Streptomyces sp. A3M-1-3]
MNVVSLGGVTVGTGILVLTGIRWWHRDKRRTAALVPFLLSAAYGMLLILSAGGLLGAIAGITLWGSNGLGDLALVWGVGGGTPDVTRSKQMALSDGGHAVVVLLTLALYGLWRWANKVPNAALGTGAVAGISLGLSGSVAGIAAVPLASAANLLGLGLTALL